MVLAMRIAWALLEGGTPACLQSRPTAWVDDPDRRLAQRINTRAPRVHVAELLGELARVTGIALDPEPSPDPERESGSCARAGRPGTVEQPSIPAAARRTGPPRPQDQPPSQTGPDRIPAMEEGSLP